MVFGVHSAEYTGVVLDFAPTAKPRAKRAIKRLYQLWRRVSYVVKRAAMGGCSRIRDRHPEASDDGDDTGNENGEPTSSNLVERRVGLEVFRLAELREPPSMSNIHSTYPAPNDCRAQVRRTIDQTLHPFAGDVELLEVEDLRELSSVYDLVSGGAETYLRSVHSSLVETLHDGGTRAQHNQEVEGEGLAPLVGDLSP